MLARACLQAREQCVAPGQEWCGGDFGFAGQLAFGLRKLVVALEQLGKLDRQPDLARVRGDQLGVTHARLLGATELHQAARTTEVDTGIGLQRVRAFELGQCAVVAPHGLVGNAQVVVRAGIVGRSANRLGEGFDRLPGLVAQQAGIAQRDPPLQTLGCLLGAAPQIAFRGFRIIALQRDEAGEDVHLAGRRQVFQQRRERALTGGEVAALECTHRFLPQRLRVGRTRGPRGIGLTCHGFAPACPCLPLGDSARGYHSSPVTHPTLLHSRAPHRNMLALSLPDLAQWTLSTSVQT